LIPTYYFSIGIDANPTKMKNIVTPETTAELAESLRCGNPACIELAHTARVATFEKEGAMLEELQELTEVSITHIQMPFASPLRSSLRKPKTSYR